jgi:drug/metabolite transporter (DMT)-like permease
MEILKSATEWAKAELFSTPFFMLFGLGFIAAGIGFWQLGKTELAKAYIVPTVVAGALLLIIGVGLYFTNKSRLAQFEKDYKQDAVAFVESEIERAESTLKEYTVVFKVIPIIIIVAALVILLVSSSTWRAIAITTIAMMIVILFIDGNAHARMKDYHEALLLV